MIISENKIALVFNKPGVFPGFEDVVSAHIQLPLQTAKLLQDSAKECHVITTEIPKNQVLPNGFKNIDLKSIHFVPDLNKQGERSAALEGQVKGIKLQKLFSHFREVRKVIKENRINVLHVFGTKKFIMLAIVYKLFNPGIKLIWTTENRYKRTSRFIEILINKSVNTIVTTTEYVQSTLAFHKNVKLIRPGVARGFVIANESVKNRVLFWRDPSPENGADIALKVFNKLAIEFEHIYFTFAVRPHWNAVVDKNKCNKSNIEYFEYPYQNNITIDRLLSESICVLFPFRELSTNPQLAVIETLNAGIPVVCSNVESNKEILEKVGLNFSLSDDVFEYENCVREMIIKHSDKKLSNNTRIQELKKYYDWRKYLSGCLEIYS